MWESGKEGQSEEQVGLILSLPDRSQELRKALPFLLP